MILTKIEIQTGPKLNFLTSLPVANKSIFQKSTLLLTCHFSNESTQENFVAEIPQLEGYTSFSIDNLIFQQDALSDIFRDCPLEDISKRLYENHERIPSPIVHALEVILVKIQRIKPSKKTIPIRLLNKSQGQNVKLKINPNTINSVLKELDNIQENSIVTIDANRNLKANDWHIFFKKFDTINFPTRTQITIEEPLIFEELAIKENVELFQKREILIAIDESLPDWVQNHVSFQEVIERLEYYDLIVFKPGMISLHMLNLILQRSLKHDSSKVILSCLYEGPWNLEYFFYLYANLNLKAHAGLHPLIQIKENATYLQLDEKANTLTLKDSLKI